MTQRTFSTPASMPAPAERIACSLHFQGMYGILYDGMLHDAYPVPSGRIRGDCLICGRNLFRK